MRTAVIVLLATTLVACSEPPSKNNPTNVAPNNTTANNANNASNNANNASNSGTNSQLACEGPAPGCGECEAAVCTDGVWSCQGTPCANGDPMDCEVSQSSSLPGVSIEFEATRCVWTLDEVSEGVQIPYVIRIVEEQQIMPASQQHGCDEPGPSGLRQQERVFGNEQSYCICDIGLCNDQPITVDLEAGDYEFEMAWDGVNWGGSSDTGVPKGDPFPPGSYTVEVRAFGTASGDEYEVVGSMKIELVE